MSAVSSFFRREPVLCIAGAAALCSAFWVPPSWDFLGYLDWRVLALLFCLMAVVSGLQQGGLFARLSQQAILRAKSVRGLCLLLVSLCFFSSMLVTNDVALLTFVPFAALVLGQAGLGRHLLYVVVLQTVAANLGSMATPVGNPQNLYLFSFYRMSPAQFFQAVLPVAALSLVLLFLLCLPIPAAPLSIRPAKQQPAPLPRRLLGHGLLFLCCLCTVLHWVPWPATLAAVLLFLLLFDRPALRQVDYGLLLTFVFFFLFVGNLGCIEPVRQWLSGLLGGRELIVSLLCSQVISNVPAAVLLSGFTSQGTGLLLGVNIGGLGTLVASLASLISFRLYAKTPEAKAGRYLGVFTLVNGGLLLFLLPFGLLLA